MDGADFAILEGDDADIEKGEVFFDAGKVGLVAAQPVERFADDDIEPPFARIAHEAAEAEAVDGAGARNRLVVILADNEHALLFGEAAAQVGLVLARGFVLQVG